MEGAEGSEADDSGVREPVSDASRLTDDLVLQILSRLPARSLHRFRCVSRHWRDLICDTDHRARMAQTLAGFMYLGWSRHDDSRGRSLRFTSARASPGGGEAAAPPPLIDPAALSFPPGFHQRLFRVQCCNGLLLLCAWAPSSRGEFNYTVCNPATDEWTTVSGSPAGADQAAAGCTTARLAFDLDPSSPSSSSSYRIFQFQNGGPRTRVFPKVWIYSSETGAWTCRECGWADGAGVVLRDETSAVFFRGKLHLCPAEPVIVSVDRDGGKWWTTPKPADPRDDGFIGGAPPGSIGVSRGRLLFLNSPEYDHTKICVWERGGGLWVPKRSIDLQKVVGGWDDCRFGLKCSVVGIHPDRSMVYFLEGKDNRLVSYAMGDDGGDGEGETICEIGYKNCYLPFVPYVPVFARSLTVSQGSLDGRARES